MGRMRVDHSQKWKNVIEVFDENIVDQMYDTQMEAKFSPEGCT